MPLAAPGSPLYEYRVSVCKSCPLYAGDPTKVAERVTSAIGSALVGVAGVCSHCGCPIASRAATSCPLGRY